MTAFGRLLAAAVGGLAVVLAVNTLRFGVHAPDVVRVSVPVDEQGAAARLAEALRFETVSSDSPVPDAATAFLEFHAFIARRYPRVHASLSRELVGGLSLLYTWRGRDPDRPAVLLMAHQDVVPVEAESRGAWTHPPFAGVVADGFVWGRGALDDKAGVMGLLEAAEALLAQGFTPERTIYLFFGHDEEIGGLGGAAVAARLLEARGVELEFVLDEGGIIARGVLPGVEPPVALIGVAEKGFVSVELTVEQAGGHSSKPPRHTAVGILSAAIARLEAAQLPARLDGANLALFEHLAGALPVTQRVAFANLWLFEALVTRQLAAEPATNALVRTTTAATMFSGGVKDNVLPTRAVGVVNFRLMPGDSVGEVLDHVRHVVDDARVAVRALPFSSEPSPVSSTQSDAFRSLATAIREVSVAPDLIVAPYLVIGATDARHFAGLAEQVLRFVGFELKPGDLDRIHGIDERIAVTEYARVIRIYQRVMGVGPR